LRASGVSKVCATAVPTPVPCVVSDNHPDGTLRFIDSSAFLGLAADGFPTRVSDSSSSEEGGAVGWPRAGNGRQQGSGLNVRESLFKVLVFVLSTSAYMNLGDLFMHEDINDVDMAALGLLRFKYKQLTDVALLTRAWSLAPSGTVGALLKFGSGGSRDDDGRHLCVGVNAELSEKAVVVCTCSEYENFLEMGCSLQLPMERALEAVRSALGVTMSDLFVVLVASCNPRSRSVGRARVYGKGICVVRMTGGSWPFAVVRKTRAHRWICIHCRTNDASCGHVEAAGAAAKRIAQEDPDTDSDNEECSTDGDGGGEGADVGGEGADDDGAESNDGDAGVLNKATDAPAAVVNEAAADVPPPRTVADNSKVSPQSLHPRHLVPPAMAQKELAAIMEALREPSIVVKYPPRRTSSTVAAAACVARTRSRGRRVLSAAPAWRLRR